MDTTAQEHRNDTGLAPPNVSFGEEAAPLATTQQEPRRDPARYGRGTVATAAVLGALVLAVAVAAVQAGGGRSARTEIAGGCPSVGRDGQPQIARLVSCLGPSLAFVTTPVDRTGSGVLVDGGFVVTNAHVVQPFDAVSVVLGGGERHTRVPVLGVDLHADLALLGPVQTRRRPLPIADSVAATAGDAVFLAGYPGEVEDTPEPAIARGILSRTRRLQHHGVTYLQTDAAIGGGQSGGALVDAAGQVIGISGHSFADGKFGLALSGPDVRRSMSRILGGDVPRYRPFPEAGQGMRSGFVEVPDHLTAQPLTLTTDEAVTVRLAIPAETQPSVLVTDLGQENVLFENAASQARRTQWGEEIEGDPDEEAAPGVFEFELPAASYVWVLLGTARTEGGLVPFESSIPLSYHDDRDDGGSIAVGQTVNGEIDPLEGGDLYLLELEAGDEVEIHAGSATGDMAYSIQAPGQAAADSTVVDDSGTGLHGLDAEERYEATASGAYQVYVFAADSEPAGYVLRVSPAPGS